MAIPAWFHQRLDSGSAKLPQRSCPARLYHATTGIIRFQTAPRETDRRGFRSAARASEPSMACLGTTTRWRWRESNPRPKQCPENVYKLSRRIVVFSRLRIPGDGDEGASRWSWAALSTSGCCIPQCLTASRKPAGGIPVDRDPTELDRMPNSGLRSHAAKGGSGGEAKVEAHTCVLGTCMLCAPFLRGSRSTACGSRIQLPRRSLFIPL